MEFGYKAQVTDTDDGTWSTTPLSRATPPTPPAAPLPLSDGDRKILTRLAASQTAPHRQVMRARVLLSGRRWRCEWP